jgi:DNA-binding response OmpR family regulator
MVVLLVTAGSDAPDPEPVVTALGGGRTGDIMTTTDGDLPATFTDDLLASLATVVVLTGAETEAAHRSCQAVRDASAVPLCMVCSSDREADEVVAFANGCDDFIHVQCSPPVLRARLNALVARGRGGAERVLTFGCMRLDPRLRTVTVGGRPVDLTRTEFDIAACLLANQRRVVARHELLETVWGVCPTHDHVLDVHMSRMRAKVLEAGGPKLGEPVPGVGYRVGRTTCPPALRQAFAVTAGRG